MKSFVLAAVFSLLISQAMCSQICHPPKSESVLLRTKKIEDIYHARDYELGLFLNVFGDDPHGDRWVMLDLNTKNLYASTPDGGCQYMSHYPEDDQRLLKSGDVLEFYYMERPEARLRLLAGMKPIPGTEYYYMYFARFFSDSVGGIADAKEDDTFGVTYKYSIGISDPTIFDKDIARCTQGPSNR
ncbi:hypothetical protein ElyMa_002935400 [Elysia marginata]|uniref:DOMON domain-containing protein n=1 Tax=Elysia marginata TaxID=1093978 RepID=A0AAV4I887_9GAST|nr:hypothetical protein ElyMa_002935400 [Elysia marginata]